MTLDIQEYKRKQDMIEAVQWDGALEEVPGLITWIQSKDHDAMVRANFSVGGIVLEVTTQGQVLTVRLGDYLAYSTRAGIEVFGETLFDSGYEPV